MPRSSEKSCFVGAQVLMYLTCKRGEHDHPPGGSTQTPTNFCNGPLAHATYPWRVSRALGTLYPNRLAYSPTRRGSALTPSAAYLVSRSH